MGLLVHPLEVGLAGEGDERRAVEEGVADRRDEVHGPGTQRAEADAGAPGEAPVHVGHVGPALLVSNRDEGDRRARQRLVEVEGLLAGDPEDVLDPLGFQALDEHVAGAPVTLSHRMQPSTATPLSGGGSGRGMRKLVLALVAALLLAAAPAAQRRDEADHHRRRLRPRHRHEPVRHVRLLAAPARPTTTSSATTTRAPRSGALDANPEVKVLLQGARKSISFAGGLNAGDQKLDPAQTYSVRRTAAGLELRDATRQERRHGRRDRCASTRPSARRCALNGTSVPGVRDGLYRGSLLISASGSGLVAVNALDLEDYVRGVVSGESPSAWPTEALKAQAVAARTYAITTHAGGARLRPVRRHALAGLPRRLGRDAQHRRRRAGHRRPGRHLRRPAGDHVLLLDLGRRDRGRRELVRRLAAQAVAEGRRRPVRQRLAQAPLGPVPLHRRPGPAQAAPLPAGALQAHQGRCSAASRRASCARRSSAPAA